MTLEEVTLDALLVEQRTTSEFVIEEVPEDSDLVLVTPLGPNMRAMCRAGVKVPKKSIERVSKIGKTARCCGKEMQVVGVEFSDEKSLTYADLLETTRSTHISLTVALKKTIRHLVQSSGRHTERLAGSTGIGAQPDYGIGMCYVDAMLDSNTEQEFNDAADACDIMWSWQR